MTPPSHALTVPTRKRSRRKRLLILASGWFFIFIGILGVFLPILQGFLFLATGFYLLSLESPRAKRMMNRFETRHPKFAAKLEEARVRAARWGRRLIHRR